MKLTKLGSILFVFLWTLTMLINKMNTQSIPISPCPKIFQYRFDGFEWFGLVSVGNPDQTQALHLRVTLLLRGKPSTNYIGEIELLTRGQFYGDMPILYKVKFPKNTFPPKVLQISTNNIIVCFGGGATDHGIFMTKIQLEHLRKISFIKSDKHNAGLKPPTTLEFNGGAELSKNFGFVPKQQQHFAPHMKFDKHPLRHSNDICGTIDEHVVRKIRLYDSEEDELKTEIRAVPNRDTLCGGRVDLVFDDTDTEYDMNDEHAPLVTRGSWPWLAAIYVNNLTSLTYHCGGTLVSTHIVVSAAHCFRLYKTNYAANEVLVFLGRHNLKNWNEEGSLAIPVDGIYIHPEYDQNLITYDADIAIIALKTEVTFSTFIRPACLWTGSTNMEYIEGEHGIVVTWNLSRNISTSTGTSTGDVKATTVPRVINAPIVSNRECFKVNAKFHSISSNRTFCAGMIQDIKCNYTQKKYAVPCSGDSGAGLMILKNNRWMLRGTVSAILPPANKQKNEYVDSNFKCNENQYTIYTDVAKFLDWILAFTI